MNLFKKKYLVTFETKEYPAASKKTITLIINQDIEFWFVEAEKAYHWIVIKLIHKL